MGRVPHRQSLHDDLLTVFFFVLFAAALLGVAGLMAVTSPDRDRAIHSTQCDPGYDRGPNERC